MHTIRGLVLSAAVCLVISGCSSEAGPIVKAEPTSASSARASVPSASASAAPLDRAQQIPSSTAAPVDPNARTVTFSTRTETVGTKYHAHFVDHAELDINPAGTVMHSVSDREDQMENEIIAVAGGVATKAKVVYTKASRRRSTDRGEIPFPGAVEGRVYLVERTASKLAITAADHKPLSPEEEEDVRSSLSTFGRPDIVGQALAKMPRRVGDRMDDVAQAMKERSAISRADTAKPGDNATDEISATFLRLDHVDGRDIAVFEITTTTSGVQNGGQVVLSTTGQVSYRVDSSEPVKTVVAGTSSFSKGKVGGHGKIDLTVSMSRTGGAP